MKVKNQSLQQWLFILAALIFLMGFAISLIIFDQSDFHLYPTMVTRSYKQARHQISVPGEEDVNLTRSGAYGIYYIHEVRDLHLSQLEMPPKMDCRLIFKKTKEVIKAVPDYVKTNRYRLSDQSIGVLIMSITVDEPGIYTFSCDKRNGQIDQETLVALGPNYFWEFLHLIWDLALPIFGGVSILCGTFVITSIFLMSSLVLMALNKKKSKNKYQD